MDQVGDRISGCEDEVEELEHPRKEHKNKRKEQTGNMGQYAQDSVRIIGIKEGEKKSQVDDLNLQQDHRIKIP